MSWNVTLFNTKQKVTSVEELDETHFVDIDFDAVLKKHFETYSEDDDHREIKTEQYSIEYFVDEEPVGYKSFSLDGEWALFALVHLAKMYDWLIYDTGSGKMIDLEHPEKNGYKSFQSYVQHIQGLSK